MESNNQRRIFSEVVSVEAWHDALQGGNQRADLFADVVFLEGRIGGEKESPVRFRLHLKQAEVVLVVPENEPVKVDMSTVSRDTPESTAKRNKIIETKRQAAASGKAGIDLEKAQVKAAASAEGEVRAGESETLTIDDTVSLMMVTHSLTGEGFHRWQVEGRVGAGLSGQPWDPEARRAQLVDTRKEPDQKLPATVRIEVRCKREDLRITGLEIKDATRWKKIKDKVAFKNNLAAAESYIRDRLMAEGLEVGEIKDPFAPITLADVSTDTP